jgi:hypothetical protein
LEKAPVLQKTADANGAPPSYGGQADGGRYNSKTKPGTDLKVGHYSGRRKAVSWNGLRRKSGGPSKLRVN